MLLNWSLLGKHKLKILMVCKFLHHLSQRTYLENICIFESSIILIFINTEKRFYFQELSFVKWGKFYLKYKKSDERPSVVPFSGPYSVPSFVTVFWCACFVLFLTRWTRTVSVSVCWRLYTGKINKD